MRASFSYLVTAMRTVRTEYFLTIGEIVEEYERNGSDVLPALFNAFWMARFEPYVREDRSAYPRLQNSLDAGDETPLTRSQARAHQR